VPYSVDLHNQESSNPFFFLAALCYSSPHAGESAGPLVHFSNGRGLLLNAI